MVSMLHTTHRPMQCRPFLAIYPSVAEDLPKGLLRERAFRLAAPPPEFGGQTCRLVARLGECLLPTPARRNGDPGANSCFSLFIRYQGFLGIWERGGGSSDVS